MTESEILATTFGFLKPIEFITTQDEEKKIRCKCLNCGREDYLISRQKLLRNDIKNPSNRSCGCLRKNKVDFNRLYGKLKPIEYSDKRIYNGPGVLCECTGCGQRLVVNKAHLVSGHTTSCGKCNIIKNDLVGKTFGRLLVLEETEKRDSDGAIIWKCQCQCVDKTIMYVDTESLKSGNTRSCGCLVLENGYESYYGKNVFKRYGQEDKEHETQVTLYGQQPGVRNTSGVVGVSFDKSRQKWVAQIGFFGKHYYLGRYENIEDAIKMRKYAEKMTHEDFLSWYNENIEGEGKETEYTGKLLEIPDRRKKSNTGIKGVRLDNRGKYYTTIYYSGKSWFLGRYADIEEAKSIRNEAEKHIETENFEKWYNTGRKNV